MRRSGVRSLLLSMLGSFLAGGLSFCAPTVVIGQISTPVSQIIYDNTGGGGADFFTSEFEFGDEVILDVHPPNRLWILTDFPVKLIKTNINRKYFSHATLEQNIREPPGGCSDVQCEPISYLNFKLIKCCRQLKRAS